METVSAEPVRACYGVAVGVGTAGRHWIVVGSTSIPWSSACFTTHTKLVGSGVGWPWHKSKLIVGLNSCADGLATKLSCAALLKSFSTGRPPEIPVTRPPTDPLPGSDTLLPYVMQNTPPENSDPTGATMCSCCGNRPAVGHPTGARWQLVGQLSQSSVLPSSQSSPMFKTPSPHRPPGSGVTVGDTVGVAVRVRVGVADRVGVGVREIVGVAERVGVPAAVAVDVGAAVGVTVAVAVAVDVGVAVAVEVAVTTCVAVAVDWGVAVPVAVRT